MSTKKKTKKVAGYDVRQASKLDLASFTGTFEAVPPKKDQSDLERLLCSAAHAEGQGIIERALVGEWLTANANLADDAVFAQAGAFAGLIEKKQARSYCRKLHRGCCALQSAGLLHPLTARFAQCVVFIGSSWSEINSDQLAEYAQRSAVSADCKELMQVLGYAAKKPAKSSTPFERFEAIWESENTTIDDLGEIARFVAREGAEFIDSVPATVAGVSQFTETLGESDLARLAKVIADQLRSKRALATAASALNAKVAKAS